METVTATMAARASLKLKQLMGTVSNLRESAVKFEIVDRYGQFNILKHSGSGFVHA